MTTKMLDTTVSAKAVAAALKGTRPERPADCDATPAIQVWRQWIADCRYIGAAFGFTGQELENKWLKHCGADAAPEAATFAKSTTDRIAAGETMKDHTFTHVGLADVSRSSNVVRLFRVKSVPHFAVCAHPGGCELPAVEGDIYCAGCRSAINREAELPPHDHG